MFTARSLQTAGLSVAIIDKGKLGSGATWAAGGILSSLNPWQQNPTTQHLINEGRNKFAALANELTQETNIDPELLLSGMLVLDIDEKQQALDWAKYQHEVVEILTQPELHEKEPRIAKSLNQALYIPNIAQIRPPKLISALQKSLKQRDIKIYENNRVKDFLINANSIIGVVTQHESLYADNIVICSGAWTKKLLQQSTSAKTDINIEPVRGQMLLYKPKKKILSHIIMQQKSYLIPRQDGHILCGSTLEHVGFVDEITQTAKQSLHTIACELLPELCEVEPIQQWSGLRPGTQGETPYICKHSVINGLFINSGHYRYGIVMSIASARIMTELITNSLNPSQLTTFSS